MILGISGKKQSGKSTVGKIVQYLIAKYTVEDTVDIFKTPLPNYKYLPFTDETNWEIKQFAGKLKEICSILTGIPVEDFEKEEVKSSYLGEEWGKYLVEVTQPYSKPLILKFKSKLDRSNRDIWKNSYNTTSSVVIKETTAKITVRELLQKVGTDAMRDVIHPDVWVNALMKDYTSYYPESSNEHLYNKFPNWIITDVRFPNEAKAIKDRQGIVIRVNRPFKVEGVYEKDESGFDVLKYTTNRSISLHESETALDDYSFDYVIENSGTIEELIEKVKQMLIHFKLL